MMTLKQILPLIESNNINVVVYRWNGKETQVFKYPQIPDKWNDVVIINMVLRQGSTSSWYEITLENK